MKCYYAHPMSIYGTPQEARDLEHLKSLGLEVINPSDAKYQDELKTYGGPVMDYFVALAKTCPVVAFRAFPDGSIPAGVAKELENALIVIELPSCIKRRTLTVEETRETLRESGQR